MIRRTLLGLVVAGIVAGGCQQQLSPQAEKGRQVYMSQCSACHNANPALPGAVGPEVKGSSEALLEARVLKGTYQPGYQPKRPTKVMQPMPQMAGDLTALAEYLR